MRKQPGLPPKDINPKQNDKVITQVREYELITPMFGGGVAPTEADPVTIIRATEIRGQLRFWWRACRSGQYGDLTTMKQAEDKFWGSASTKQGGGTSQVDIQVLNISIGGQQAPFTITANGRVRSEESVAPGYAAFPLQSSDAERGANAPLKTVSVNVSFTLTISFPTALRTDIEAALWAWETFGGIGARTRRGFGALRLRSIDGVSNTDLPLPNAKQAESWIKNKLARFVSEGTPPAGVPHLSRTLQLKVTNSSQNVIAAWGALIRKLASFRQAPDGRHGRSDWPEPEAIRQITQRRYYKYQARPHPRKFPRAAFGLPIIFHFKDDKQGDPNDTTLQGAERQRERLASPLILHPLACKDGWAAGLALLLEGPRIPPGGIILDCGPEHKPQVDSQLTPNEAKAIPVLEDEQDILKAFMNYLGRIPQ